MQFCKRNITRVPYYCWGTWRHLSLFNSFPVINDFPDGVIYDVAVCADDITLYFESDRASGLWQQLQLSCEGESDINDTMDWGRKWLVSISVRKSQLVLFHRKITGAIYVKMDGSTHNGKLCYKMLGFTFTPKLDWGSCIVSFARIASSWNLLWSVLHLWLCFIAQNLPPGQACNAAFVLGWCSQLLLVDV